jgi:hypothetical protein
MSASSKRQFAGSARPIANRQEERRQQQHTDAKVADIGGAVVAGLVSQEIGRSLDWIEDDRINHDSNDEIAHDRIERGALGDGRRDRDQERDASREIGDCKMDECNSCDQPYD